MADDDEYLNALLPAVKTLMEFQPDMLFLRRRRRPLLRRSTRRPESEHHCPEKRDAGVFELARQRNIPVVTTQAGGYARRLEDTVQIHVNTIQAAIDLASS